MYVVLLDGFDGLERPHIRRVATLEQAFAQIVCHCGYAYRFEQEADGWKLVLTNVEHPEYNPDPIFSDYIKPRDARHDLMEQAVDGRLKAHMAVTEEEFQKMRALAPAD
jgi:hypothetical protein